MLLFRCQSKFAVQHVEATCWRQHARCWRSLFDANIWFAHTYSNTHTERHTHIVWSHENEQHSKCRSFSLEFVDKPFHCLLAFSLSLARTRATTSATCNMCNEACNCNGLDVGTWFVSSIALLRRVTN